MMTGIQQPVQERSVQTMNHILDAAADLLEERLFEEISIAEIVEQAGCSVGAFYGRFKDKNSLLMALDERHFEEFDVGTNLLIVQLHNEKTDLPSVIRKIVQFLVDVYGGRPGLLRALVLYAKQHADEGFRLRERRAWEVYPQLHSIIRSYHEEIHHPDPDFAIRFGFIQTFFTASEVLLWGTRSDDFTIPPQKLVEELTRSYLAYLGVQP
jgi:AcrR family transcriptional regulator